MPPAPPAPESASEREERLKAATWYAVGQAVDAFTLNPAINMNATPQYIGGLSEMVFAQIQTVAGDLEAYAKHAGRKVVTQEDVLLLARRNEELREMLKRKGEGN